MRQDTLPLGHFEALYANRPDPWRLASSDYERGKYAATLAALPRPHYAHGFEIGCAIGVFTAALAQRCERLLAAEPVDAALAQARQRNVDNPHVRFARLFVPKQWPPDRFDLIVVSEVLDYLGERDIATLGTRVGASLEAGGDLILVHWVGKKNGPSGGDEAADRLIAALRADVVVLKAERNLRYRLDLLRRM